LKKGLIEICGEEESSQRITGFNPEWYASHDSAIIEMLRELAGRG
jgi:hypothetical protein